jgi:tetratricopeptide (TPR) repeat protein
MRIRLLPFTASKGACLASLRRHRPYFSPSAAPCGLRFDEPSHHEPWRQHHGFGNALEFRQHLPQWNAAVGLCALRWQHFSSTSIRANPLQVQERLQIEAIQSRLTIFLDQYQTCLGSSDETSRGDTGETRQQEQRLLEQIRDAHEELQDWQRAIVVEAKLYDEFYGTAQSMAASDHRRGKYFVRWMLSSSNVTDEESESKKISSKEAETKAVFFFERSLENYRVAHGQVQAGTENTRDAVYHADIGHVHVSMAGVYFHQAQALEDQDTAEREACLRRALSILLDEAHDHFRYHGRTAEEARHQKQQQSAAVGSPDMVKYLQHVGLIYRHLHEYDRALLQYEEAYRVTEQFFSDSSSRIDPLGINAPADADSSDLASIMHDRRQNLLLDMADTYFVLDRFDESLQCYQELLPQRHDEDATPAPVSSALEGIVLHNIGRIYIQQGDFDQAIPTLKRAIVVKQQHLGTESHPEIAKTLDALGAVYASIAKAGDSDKGISAEYLAKASHCFRQSLLIARMHAAALFPDRPASEDPQVIICLRNLATLAGNHSFNQGR